MQISFRSLFAALAAFLGLTVVGAAEEPLVTDRPDFTESSSSVGAGVLQLESGITYAEFGGGGDVITVPEILARWGVLEKLELRFLLPSYAWESGSGRDSSGYLSSGVGLKYRFADGNGSGLLDGMEAAIIASTSIPTGTADFSSSVWQPAAVLCASWELATNVGIGTSLGISRPAGDGTRFTTLWARVSLAVGLTDSMSGFVELYGFNREQDRGPNTAAFQTGLVYLFKPDLQVDVRVARRLTDSGPDFLIGAGLSSWLGG